MKSLQCLYALTLPKPVNICGVKNEEQFVSHKRVMPFEKAIVAAEKTMRVYAISFIGC